MTELMLISFNIRFSKSTIQKRKNMLIYMVETVNRVVVSQLTFVKKPVFILVKIPVLNKTKTKKKYG